MATTEPDKTPGKKDWLKNKFQKKSYTQHQFHDPTYTSFFIMIDWHHSKLFNGMAVEFLKDTLGDVARAEKLERFTNNFRKLVMEMPWCFQEMEGLDNAFKGFDLKKNFRGGDDAVIKFKMLESTDLLITGLVDMYRDVVLDLKRWCRVLPSNMTYFDMYIVVSDARRITKRRPDVTNHGKSDFSNDPRKHFEINTGIAGSAKAHFMVKFKKCSFKLDSATEIFAGISNAEPKLIEGVALEIGYQIIEYYSKQYLNAFEGTIAENKISQTEVGPQPGQDNPPQPEYSAIPE